MYIDKVVLKNIRGFADLQFDLARPSGAYAGWTVFISNNGSGKSTLLKAIGYRAVLALLADILRYHDFAEINDPKDFCKDVSSLGRWSNGDVEVGLATLDELPYVMGLVRQSFERQMGNGEVA